MERITLTRGATTEATPSSLRITIRVKTRPLRLVLLSSAPLLWGLGAAWLVVPPCRLSDHGGAGAQNFGLLVFGVVRLGLPGRLAWILIGSGHLDSIPLA